MKLCTLKFFCGLVCAFFVINPLVGVPANTDTEVSSEAVTINMQDTDIRTFIKWIAERTAKNFVIDPRVKGKINVISHEALTPEEAYQVFLSVLQVHNFTAVTTGQVIKIIPDTQAKHSALPMIDQSPSSPQHDQMVVRVLKPKNIAADKLASLLKPFIPQSGLLVAYPESNALILSDRIANIDQLLKIIQHIDQQGGLDVEIITLKHAEAKAIVGILTNLVPKGGGANTSQALGVSFAADDRTNSILLVGEQVKKQQLKNVIALLDKPQTGSGDTEVVYLYYLKASEVAPILQNLAGGFKKEQKDIGIERAEISIQANDSTNALVITAPPPLMAKFKSVVRKLDIRRAQVMVEALIVEVGEETSHELGIQWNTSPGALNNEGVFGGTRNPLNNIESLDVFPGDPVSLGSGLSLGIYHNGSLRALVRALQSDDAVNILSTPTVSTLDNETAKITVGQNVPFVTGRSTSESSSTSNPFQTIERKDVGIQLEITPQINEGDAVTLEVFQEISSVTDSTQASDIITNQRSIKTRVLVESGTVLVIGGLISDEQEEDEVKVPFLGDLPVIGYLFKSERTKQSKRNLMVFLRPTIIQNKKQVKHITQTRYQNLKSNNQPFQQRLDEVFKRFEASRFGNAYRSSNNTSTKSNNKP
ncbi:type II secretion system secretin GspD [Zooshikella marina]|uniref:type II secretion system secretin GspD n=1 Tax=Zooshikella ganghwensis TaxID=202772 RepID=UPI001BAF0214|nr:type II secretion system secretin GspD [Zooshikella ganghwensis]MBU2708274.1 type II secretion system secretin GspD [Zooshikella ganghwensis]